MPIRLPIKVLHKAEGHIVTLETITGEVYRGKLIEAEDNMNLSRRKNCKLGKCLYSRIENTIPHTAGYVAKCADVQETDWERWNARNDRPISKNEKPPISATNLLDGLPFGQFVLFLYETDNNNITSSGLRSRVRVEERPWEWKGISYVDILVNGRHAASEAGSTIKIAKEKAYEAALIKLKEECFAIKTLSYADRIEFSKSKPGNVICKIVSENAVKTLNPYGSEILDIKSTEFTIRVFVRNICDAEPKLKDSLTKEFIKALLQKCAENDDIRDLFFDSSFTKDEREFITRTATTTNLNVSSRWMEPYTNITVAKTGKHVAPLRILEEVLIERNPKYLNKYEVRVPAKFRNDFPKNIAFSWEFSANKQS